MKEKENKILSLLVKVVRGTRSKFMERCGRTNKMKKGMLVEMNLLTFPFTVRYVMFPPLQLNLLAP
ncbi:hypothetical protein [Pseudogracilibacillus sp. SO10305]|uniref:hypothetical protein n=1 Tax=Pseudogracilibacillus sp. SO10305 TaxID=3098292 RepID=UPI00300DF365